MQNHCPVNGLVDDNYSCIVRRSRLSYFTIKYTYLQRDKFSLIMTVVKNK